MAEKFVKHFRIHVGLVLAEFLCVTAFVVEIRRALSGNTLSWAYVFEWPLFAGYGVYMWRKLLKENDGASPKRDTPVDARSDEVLRAYNDYLHDVHEKAPEESEDL